MAYNLDNLKISLENARFDEAYYTIFFVEAEKLFREMIPVSSITAKLYRTAEEYFNNAYNYDDLIQDCLLRLWECINELKLTYADGITFYLMNLAHFKLKNFVTKQANRIKITTFSDVSEATDSPFFDGCFEDEEELSTVAESYKVYNNFTRPLQPEETVIQVEKDTYRKIAEFPTVSEAARISGVERANISKVLSGKGKTAGGYIWIKSSNPLIGLIKNV